MGNKVEVIVAPFVGLMLGVEFHKDEEETVLVIDLLVLRVMVFFN